MKASELIDIEDAMGDVTESVPVGDVLKAVVGSVLTLAESWDDIKELLTDEQIESVITLIHTAEDVHGQLCTNKAVESIMRDKTDEIRKVRQANRKLLEQMYNMECEN